MSLTDLQIASTAAVAVAAAAVGAFAGGSLVRLGLAQLEVIAPKRARAAGCVTGALGGVAAVLASRHAGSWWLLPALLVWACGLAAAAVCDAVAQRVPTPLARRATLATAGLILGSAAATGHWRWPALALICAAAAGVVFAFCWRFLDAGFGDVRIAVLGGLGLVHPTPAGLVMAVAAFVVIIVSQVIGTFARGGNRRTLFPYGPAIAAAFLVAAIR